MANNNLVKPQKRDIMLHSTSVENLFISELLPIAPGDYVKVYLFGLMNAEYECSVDKETASRVLGIEAEEIENAWAYWEDKGAVIREYDSETGGYKIVFVSQIEMFYGGGAYAISAPQDKEAEFESAPSEEIIEEKKPEKPVDFLDDDAAMIVELELRALFTSYEEATGRPISRKESDKIRSAINVYGVMPDVFSYAIKYCSEIEKYNIDYISTVALRWTEEGCKDISQVKELLDRESKRTAAYARIFKELGFSRMVSPGDREIMSRWFDEMNFKMSDVLEACRKSAGLREPSLRYVDKILENKYKEAGGVKQDGKPTGTKSSGSTNVSKKVLSDYFEYLRRCADMNHIEHLETAQKIPKLNSILALENELNTSLSTINFVPNSKEERRAKIARLKDLAEEKVKVLVENGYPADYLEKHFKCDLCKDTGVTDTGQFCSCVKARAAEAYTWNQKRRNRN